MTVNNNPSPALHYVASLTGEDKCVWADAVSARLGLGFNAALEAIDTAAAVFAANPLPNAAGNHQPALTSQAVDKAQDTFAMPTHHDAKEPVYGPPENGLMPDVPFTADAWSLNDLPGAEEAALHLGQELSRRMAAEALNAISLRPSARIEAVTRIMDAMNLELRKYSDLGATDTEPRGILRHIVATAFGITY
jgi:hypothetical protein